MTNYKAHRVPHVRRPVEVGTLVRLRNDVKRDPVPEGRVDNRSARVRSISEDGAAFMDRDLNGCRYWNIDDLQPVGVYGCRKKDQDHG